MLTWDITIHIFDSSDKLVDVVEIKKDFATLYAAEKFAIEQGEKLCAARPGNWFLVKEVK